MKSSPESSENLFFSPPRAYAAHGPADEVNELALEAQNVQTLNSAVAVMLQDPDKKKDFMQHMNRHIQLIKSRSQAFEDAHVTVYDKTLLTLTRNGNKLDHAPAIEYYCDEFLGVSNIGDQALATRLLEQSICVPKLLTQEHTPPPSDARSSMGSCETLANSQRRQSNTTLTSSDKSSVFARKTPDMEPHLSRLWSLYEKARADFQAVVPLKDSEATADSARFLRDTAENTIQYLKAVDFDPVMMAELHAVSDLAKATAVSATGGKKRKFDIAATDQVKEEARGPYHASGIPRRDRFCTYPRSNHHDRYNVHGRTERGRVQNVGRGPSGIPYGCAGALDFPK